MGHRDTSTQLRRERGVFAARGGFGASRAASDACAGNAAFVRRLPHRTSVAASILLGLIRAYIALLSPFLGGACKFYPSCSNYAHEAIAMHGARRGTLLALKRLGRCHPFRKGGFDPVPDAGAEKYAFTPAARTREGQAQ